MTNDHYEAAKTALDILREAEVSRGDVPDFDLTQAFQALKRYAARIDQAKREAEEAQAKGYRLRVLESGMGPAAVRAWSEIGEIQRDQWRRQYLAAREFFKEKR